MGKFWTLLTQLHSVAGPVTMLLYPLYASIVAMETTSKLDDEQWLAYWILYSFITLAEMVLQPILEWIPIWYTVKLIFGLWLVLPQFKGAAFLYDRFVRQQIKKHGFLGHHQQQQHQQPQQQQQQKSSPNGKGKKKFVQFITTKKDEHEAY
ncbi:HVA22-like protein e [Ziziphus jujuba]|uniref:HVA22-like protein n=1 Tax=Ziziphus jujuba TaxID=326968 RepID=A0A6P3YR19_ZIZJJ|nr:HVA22-like protein e [Ziziphus jujuba]